MNTERELIKSRLSHKIGHRRYQRVTVDVQLLKDALALIEDDERRLWTIEAISGRESMIRQSSGIPAIREAAE